MDTAVRLPLSQRINFRMLVFAIVVGTMVGFPLYWYLYTKLSGGIKQRGDVYEVDLKSLSTFPFDQANGTINDIP